MGKERQGSSSPERRSAENVSPAGHPPSSRTDVSPRNDPQADMPRQSAQQNSQAESNDPKEPIDDFDWVELEKRFHSKMKECEHVEQEIYEEFNNLLEVFNAWASAISGHENDRAHKRLKTRMSFVQAEESSLENKRQHSIVS
ncbi:MAG: hypothetical protein LQ347_006050, partial [Umbilicaria vellea]